MNCKDRFNAGSQRLVIYKLVIFEGDGGKDDYGEETGKLVSKYQAVSLEIPKILVMYPNNSSAR